MERRRGGRRANAYSWGETYSRYVQEIRMGRMGLEAEGSAAKTETARRGCILIPRAVGDGEKSRYVAIRCRHD